MSIQLTITTDCGDRSQLTLRPGDAVLVGRSPWADVPLPGSGLREQHLRLRGEAGGLRIEAAAPPMIVDGEPLDAVSITHDRRVAIDGLTIDVRGVGLQSPDSTVRDETAPLCDNDEEFDRVLTLAGLTPAASSSLIAGDLAASIDALTDADDHESAFKLATAATARPDAIDELIEFGQLHSDFTSDVVVQLHAFLADAKRSELTAEAIDIRIAAGSANDPATWLWKALRWAAPSMAGPTSPLVPPPSHLFVVGLFVAATLIESRGAANIRDLTESFRRRLGSCAKSPSSRIAA